MGPRFRYVICREVIEPRRAGINEAGIDFFIPTNLTPDDLFKANKKVNHTLIHSDYPYDWPNTGTTSIKTVDGFVTQIIIGASSRIIIPSGVCGLLEPSNSMLMAANKSGVSTKKGLIYGAEIVDSTYIGEIHINLINTSDIPQVIDVRDEKAVLQFIHVPIYPTIPERISFEEFELEAKNWSDRGSNWQGSTDGKGIRDIDHYGDKPNS